MLDGMIWSIPTTILKYGAKSLIHRCLKKIIMKKPEFPKPRLIREDFLPKQDPLMNYRIKKVTKPDGKVWYYPQKKFLWFWMSLDDDGGYGSERWAQQVIFEYYNKTLKDKVEYLAPDISKTVTAEPNPPPKNP